MIELRETKVDPDFFRMGLGKQLVLIAQTLAREMGKTLYLMPERPGEGLVAKVRDKLFPMTVEQIRNFYLANGFRPLTTSERFEYSKEALERELQRELYFAGLNPETLALGDFGENRYCMDPRSPKAMAILTLPIRLKLELLLKHFEEEKTRYAPKDLVDQRIKSAVERISGMLVLREDVEPNPFKPSYRILHPPRKPPEMKVRSRI